MVLWKLFKRKEKNTYNEVGVFYEENSNYFFTSILLY